MHSNYLSLSSCRRTSIPKYMYFEKKTYRQKNKTKQDERCAFSQPTGAASLDPDYITVTSLQTSRESLLSFEKFRYLDVPKLDEIMVYDDFECSLMGR